MSYLAKELKTAMLGLMFIAKAGLTQESDAIYEMILAQFNRNIHRLDPSDAGELKEYLYECADEIEKQVKINQGVNDFTKLPVRLKYTI